MLKTLRHFGPSTSKRLFSTEKKVTEVSTTGYSYRDGDGKMIAKYGVFWGLNDPKNVFQRLPAGATSVSAMYTGILDAINMASEQDSDSPLIVYTDLENEDFLKDLSVYAKRDFYKRDNVTKMKHSELLKEIFVAVQGMDVKVVYRPASGTGKPNYVANAIMKNVFDPPGDTVKNDNNVKNYCFSEDSGEAEARKAIYEGFCVDKYGQRIPSQALLKRNYPQCYVGVRCRESKNYISAGYCTYWPKGEAGGGNVHRFAPFPITAYRATLAAIEEALKEANDNGIKNVIITTSSAHFIQQWKETWAFRTEEDKSSRRSRSFYNKIRDLSEKLDNVCFRFEVEMEERPIYSEIVRRCKEGLQYPLTVKDKTEYSLTIDDLTSPETLEEVEDIPVVRLFKSGSIRSSGIVWQNEETIDVSTGLELNVIKIMEKAIANGQSSVIVRTDSEKLIKNAEALVELWKRNGWRNSLNKKIKKVEIWEKIWKLKQNVKIYWQYMDTFTEKDEEEHRKIPIRPEKEH